MGKSLVGARGVTDFPGALEKISGAIVACWLLADVGLRRANNVGQIESEHETGIFL